MFSAVVIVIVLFAHLYVMYGAFMLFYNRKLETLQRYRDLRVQPPDYADLTRLIADSRLDTVYPIFHRRGEPDEVQLDFYDRPPNYEDSLRIPSVANNHCSDEDAALVPTQYLHDDLSDFYSSALDEEQLEQIIERSRNSTFRF